MFKVYDAEGIKARLKEKDDTIFKFVKVNGQYRFFSYHLTHKDLVEPNEVAEAAGIMSFDGIDLVMLDPYSSSLKVGCSGNEYEELGALFKTRVRGKWE